MSLCAKMAVEQDRRQMLQEFEKVHFLDRLMPMILAVDECGELSVKTTEPEIQEDEMPVDPTKK